MAAAIRPALRYSAVAIVLHWSIAGLIAANLLLGWTFRSFEPETRRLIMATHRSIGLTVLMLTCMRILWRLTHKRPPFPEHLGPFVRTIASAVHATLYGLTLAVPLAGWILSSSWQPPRAFRFWGLPFPFFPEPPMSADATRALLNGAAIVHERLAWVLAALVLLHVSGALKHQLLDRDGELGRMMPGTRIRARR